MIGSAKKAGSSGNGSTNRSRGGMTLSSKAPNDEEEVRTSTLELVTVGSRREVEGERGGNGGVGIGVEPDHERRVDQGNWV